MDVMKLPEYKFLSLPKMRVNLKAALLEAILHLEDYTLTPMAERSLASTFS